MTILLVNFFDIFAFVFNILLLIRVILSFVVRDYYKNWFTRLIFECSEPILQPVRKILPSGAGIDFSPLVVFLVIELLSYFLHSLVTAA